jgi:MraZ protein
MEYLSTLDDKGRISLPARIRSGLKANSLILTKGNENSVWLFTPQEWEVFSEKLMAAPSLTMKESIIIQHRFIVPMVELEIDKAGRIAIPQSLRDFAGLSRDCKILEARKHLELWDSGRYEAFLRANDEELQKVLEKMGPVALFT